MFIVRSQPFASKIDVALKSQAFFNAGRGIAWAQLGSRISQALLVASTPVLGDHPIFGAMKQSPAYLPKQPKKM